MSSRADGSYFEISLEDNEGLKSPRSPLTPRTRSLWKDVSIRLDDVVKKLEDATERRSKVIQETREKNEQHVRRVSAVVHDKKEVSESRVAELRESLEMDLALKDKRRQQIIDEKIGLAKKENEKVERLRSSLASTQEEKTKLMQQDLSNKENNRRSIIQGIKESCQQETLKVAEVKLRRSLSTNDDDN